MTPEHKIRHFRSELLAPLVRNVIFPLWVARDHPGYHQFFREFQKNQFLSPTEIVQLQLSRLKRLLEHAIANCPYYRNRAAKAGFSTATLTTLQDLRRFPPLTKGEIQDSGVDMLATNIPPNQRVRNQTGGSTGSPLQFYVDKKRFASRAAATNRHNLWAGFRPGDWCAYLWGARLDQIIQPGLNDWVKNLLLYRRLELNTSQIEPRDWEQFVKELRRKRPRFMVAYAQSAVQLGRYVREHQIDDVAFEAIITTAEVLAPEQRSFLQETFGGKVFNRYGCRELSVIASECEYQKMHVNADALLVEIVRDPSSNDESGGILITDLLNYSMPLIRYEIQDVGTWAREQNCACGRGLPILHEVRGRTTDFLVMNDGTQISGPALTLVVADMADVRQVQFVQRAADQVTLRVVPGNGYGEATRTELQKRLNPYLRNRALLTIEEVNGIPRTLSGKYRFVIREMEKVAEQFAGLPQD